MTDLLVVGSGGGALTGALLAAAAGLRTVVVEATDRIGGTSAYSGGACWLPGSAVQQRAGLPDSTDGARAYLDAVLALEGFEPDADRLEAFLAGAPRLVTRLEELGVPFEWLPFPEYYAGPGRVPAGRSIQPTAVKRDALPAAVADLVRPPVELDRAGAPGRRTLTGGQALIARLAAAFVEHGGRILTEHRVESLLGSEADDGGVRGVVARTPDGVVELEASAVLLGSGGFERDRTLRADHGVPGDPDWSMAPADTNRGEPITAALATGAAADWTGHGWFCPGLLQPDGGGSFTLGFRSGLMLDRHGRRYGNECLPYDRFGRIMAADADRVPSWFVFDSREDGRLPAIAMPEGDPAQHLAAGTWVRADTLEELAGLIDVDPATLRAQVERFNGFCATGVDEDFGRGEDEYDTFFAGGSGANAALTPVDRAPFLAARFVLSDLGTKGGVAVDAAACALRPDGTPLPGLYACGNAASSLFGPVYPGPGAPLGSAMVAAAAAVEDLTRR